MLDFTTLKQGDKIVDNDGDEHVFIAFIPDGRREPVITFWGGRSVPTSWPADVFPAPKQAIYVNVYGSVFDGLRYERNATRAQADRNASSERIACVRVEFTPGQLDE